MTPISKPTPTADSGTIGKTCGTVGTAMATDRNSAVNSADNTTVVATDREAVRVPTDSPKKKSNPSSSNTQA